MKTQKLTRAELTSMTMTMQNSINGLLGLLNAYIEYKDDIKGFKEFVDKKVKGKKNEG